ncbi:hypothetical protein [Peptoniphilus harei]|uniref:hypothetical protein n=1 Tax=Peptoniphilus harei TaxID=54005 RepID=UPI0011DD3A14|nr:hypothetical protein [Peptoniphilus harei]
MKIIDVLTNAIYAEGKTEEELVKNWNENSQNTLSWLLEYGEDDLYNDLTSEMFRLENLEDAMHLINTIDGNQLILI